MTTFKQLGLSDNLLKVINELGFEKPSDIQSEAIPVLLHEDRDFIGLAQTGTGKTAAFGLPLLERIDSHNKATQALILAPTRELGQQIAEQLHIFSKYVDRVNVLAVYGGASITAQMKALRKPQQVIIATPGRLIDLIQRKAVKLDQLRYLVLDEADEMLNMGFKDEIDKILSYAPKNKSTWLFSATMPKEMNSIVKRYMQNPVEVVVNSKNEVNANIDHQFVMVNNSDKLEALIRFIDANPGMRALIFCRTRRNTQKLADQLLKKNYKADALHGDMSQGQRDKVMGRFKKHSLQLLIATDVAARGIDVNDITHVFHHTLPDDISYYTHRSGRTARAGKKGTSISFISGQDKNSVNKISKQLDISFSKTLIPNSDDIVDTKVEDWCLDILNQHPNGNIEAELFEKANMLFFNLSKEELIAKLLTKEMGELNSNSKDDLNKAAPNPRSHNKSRKRSGKSKNYHRKGNKNHKKNHKKKGKKKSHYEWS